MIERKKTDLRSQSGFTLLEMMSVLVILPAPGEVGGSLHFGPKTIALVRNHSTNKSAGSWQ